MTECCKNCVHYTDLYVYQKELREGSRAIYKSTTKTEHTHCCIFDLNTVIEVRPSDDCYMFRAKEDENE